MNKNQKKENKRKKNIKLDWCSYLLKENNSSLSSMG